MSNRVKQRIQNKINNMGLIMNANIFIYMRLISSIILFIISLFISNYGYIIAPVSTIFYYILVEYIILDLGVKSYAKELDKYAIPFFSLFKIHLKYTRNIKKSIDYTTSIIENKLSFEFRKVLVGIEIGKSLEESLTELNNRIPNDNIKTIITAMIECHRVGTNIEKIIDSQLNYIDERNKNDVLKKLRTIPIKMAIVSLVFVFLMIMIIVFIKNYIL